MTDKTELNKGFTDEELLQSYPPTKEQFLNNHKMIDKMEKELQKRIDEETRHINHKKDIYKSVKHNCEYNLTVCKNLKEILSTTYHSKCSGGET